MSLRVCFVSLLATAACAALTDVEHIVVFMQENRAYDHYYGALRGVRGFGDRAAPALPNGRSPFYQPIGDPSADLYQLPYYMNFTNTSATCAAAPAMGYSVDLAMWNLGRMDSWCTARDAGYGMGHFDRYDLPFYYALADAFTIGDQATNPNRMFLFSGSNGPSAGHTPPCLDDSEPVPGWNWTTMAETLEAANVSWRVYEEWDNFDDNGFSWFSLFQESKPGSVWWDKGQYRVPQGTLVDSFARDMEDGKLPQVSWIVGPTRQSEHANNHPQNGQDLSARLIAALKANPDVYAKTVFLIDYDEGGQFYDHHWTPNPPLSPSDGVTSVTTEGEIYMGGPMGMGFRVPFFAVSPWSRGGWVVSEVFDHTSVIKFIEARFGVHCPNISPWRRAIAGDLTSAFDFEHPDYTWPDLPSTKGAEVDSLEQCLLNPPPTVPTIQAMPTPEPGTRPSRPLPYEFAFTDAVSASGAPGSATVSLSIRATGAAAGAFQQHNWAVPSLAPRRYAVTPGASITDVFNASAFNASTGAYAMAVHGPNGWVRALGGDLGLAASPGAPAPALTVAYNAPALGTLTLMLSNGAGAGAPVAFSVVDEAYGLQGSPWTVGPVAAGASVNLSVPLGTSGWWYDLNVTTAAPHAGLFWRRLMGRMETGEPSTSDPAYGKAGVPSLHRWVDPATHPELPAELIAPPRWTPEASRAARETRQPNKDAGARLFDEL